VPHPTVELLAAGDPLTHHARMSALAGHARRLAVTGNPDPEASRLAWAALPAWVRWAPELTALADLVADRPVLAGRLAETLTDQVRRADGSWDPAVLTAVVAVAAAPAAPPSGARRPVGVPRHRDGVRLSPTGR